MTKYIETSQRISKEEENFTTANWYQNGKIDAESDKETVRNVRNW